MFQLLHGDCIEQMRAMPDNSVDAIVTDPPYGINFMGKAWDNADILAKAVPGKDHTKTRERSASMHAGEYDLSLKGNQAFEEWTRLWAVEAFRVLKPGGHLLAFSGSRTYHRMAAGVEDAGFEIRDQIMWLYGSGFPKSKNVALSIDKGEGHPNRGKAIPTASTYQATDVEQKNKLTSNPVPDYEAKSEAAKDWQGWGTALKPAHEPIVVARKPLNGTVAANVLAYGTGALNIDGCRVGTEERPVMVRTETVVAASSMSGTSTGSTSNGDTTSLGRWPANVIHDGSDEVTTRLGEPARFFYCAKASKRDRNEGLDGFVEQSAGEVTDRQDGSAGLKSPRAGAGRTTGNRNHHPTVKPTELMRYLVRLVTPPNGTVLDPFTGSGSTGKACMLEGFQFIGIEQDADYIEIARARIQWAWDQMVEAAVNPQPDLFDDLADDVEASA